MHSLIHILHTFDSPDIYYIGLYTYIILYISSLSDLPPGRSKCPTTPLFSMLRLFLEFPVSVLHYPVNELLSRPSSSSLPIYHSFHYLLCKELPLRMCPIQFFCLVLIISIKDLFSSTFLNTSSFVLCFVQLILSILLHIHISKASIRLTSSFLIVHVSAPYSLCFLNLLPSVVTLICYL